MRIKQENDRLREKVLQLEGNVRDARNRADAERRQHHHEVLLAMINTLAPQVTYAGRHVAATNPRASWAEVVAAAREVADAAYPPPTS